MVRPLERRQCLDDEFRESPSQGPRAKSAQSRKLSGSEKINTALRQLDGQKLTSIKQTDGDGACSLEFDLGGSLQIGPPEPSGTDLENDEAQWTLFFENGDYISYTSTGKLQNKSEEQG